MEKIQLVVPQFHSITRSYSGKINLSNHVEGHDYESKDFFASHNESIPVEEATPEKIKEVSERLYQMSKAEVEASELVYLNEIKRAAGMTIEPTGEEYKAISDIIVAFESSITSEDVKKASEIAKERKSNLNDVQLEYLRTIARKADARTLS
mgnify:CR=1 FL=1